METETIEKKDVQEFKALLEESFKKNSIKESTIIKAKVSEIGKKFVLCEIPGSKFEGSIATEEFKSAKELNNLKVGSNIEPRGTWKECFNIEFPHSKRNEYKRFNLFRWRI